MGSSEGANLEMLLRSLGPYKDDSKLLSFAIKLAVEHKLCAQNVPADGSCMLHAIKRSLTHRGVLCPSTVGLRRLAVDRVYQKFKADPEGYGIQPAHGLKRSDNDEPLADAEAYLAAASQPTCALGHAELQELAEYLDVGMVLYSSDGHPPLPIGSNTSQTIDLLHVNSNHYMALLPVHTTAGTTLGKNVIVKPALFSHPCIAKPADLDARLHRQEVTQRKHSSLYTARAGKPKRTASDAGPTRKSPKQRRKEAAIKTRKRVLAAMRKKRAQHVADMMILKEAIAENGVETETAVTIVPSIRRLPAGWQARCRRLQRCAQPAH